MDNADRFYIRRDDGIGTHLALRWNGRVRYTVPRETAGQRACWEIFRPGRLGIPLRAQALLPRLLGATNCLEAETLTSIREALGNDAGLSCCRSGAPGVWSKDTILFLDKKTTNPLYLVKAGTGEAVDSLLRNETGWLKRLRLQAQLAGHIPELIACRAGSELSFVAQSIVPGHLDFKLGRSHFEFLLKLQEYSRQSMQYEDSILCRTLDLRLKDLCGLLSDPWSIRLDKAMRRIKKSLSRSPVRLVTAHNDFTPWNVRLQRNFASVFDWEYAADEQLPLFDPLHFALMQMALRREPPPRIIRTMNRTLQRCRRCLGKRCATRLKFSRLHTSLISPLSICGPSTEPMILLLFSIAMPGLSTIYANTRR